jgi:hypothetical protein
MSLIFPHAGLVVWSQTPDTLVEAPDHSREDMFSRVSRLKEGSTTIGTCCRLADGIILTARHNISPPDLVRYLQCLR